MSAEASVYIAFAFVAVMSVFVLAVAVMVLVDLAAAWTPKPRPRHAAVKSPGVQFFARSAQTTTAPIVIHGRTVR